MADTAYTNLALAPHTDNTYFTEPAGLQAFHMLSHQAGPGEKAGDGNMGGNSILVDGFSAAARMREVHPDEFQTLASVRIPWHASGNEGIAITPINKHPVIELTPGQGEKHIQRIRWNNDDRGTVPVGQAESWYKAARIWDSLMKEPARQYHFQLTPGRVLSE